MRSSGIGMAQEVEELSLRVQQLDARWERDRDTIVRLTMKVERLKVALGKYGEHVFGCASKGGRYAARCECGLREAMEE